MLQFYLHILNEFQLLSSSTLVFLLFGSYKFKLEDGAAVKPQVPLLNNRIYDTKFESQFYMISDTNKVREQFILS
jgi:tripeptidyl-peptidase-2